MVRSSGAASKDAINSGRGVNAWRIESRACAAGSISVGCFDSAVTAHADQAATDAADAMRKADRSLGAAVLAALRRAAVRRHRRRGGVERRPDAAQSSSRLAGRMVSLCARFRLAEIWCGVARACGECYSTSAVNSLFASGQRVNVAVTRVNCTGFCLAFYISSSCLGSASRKNISTHACGRGRVV